MADDPRKEDYRDRSRVSGSEDYEVRYLAEQAGISMDQARALIRQHGNDRETLMQAARALRKH